AVAVLPRRPGSPAVGGVDARGTPADRRRRERGRVSRAYQPMAARRARVVRGSGGIGTAVRLEDSSGPGAPFKPCWHRCSVLAACATARLGRHSAIKTSMGPLDVPATNPLPAVRAGVGGLRHSLPYCLLET